MKERKRENSLQHSSWKYGYFAILAAYFQTTHTHTHTLSLACELSTSSILSRERKGRRLVEEKIGGGAFSMIIV